MAIETSIIERMYGVNHGFVIDLMSLCSPDYPLLPSAELETDLINLPKGSTIGIEDFDPMEIRKETYKINGESFHISKHSKAYWKRVKEVCKFRGHNIVYLDSFKIYKEAVARAIGMGCGGGFELFNESFDRVLASGGLTVEGYRAGIEAEYIFQVEREEEIIKRLSKFQPRRAIIGLAHGDFIASQRSRVAEDCLVIGDYRREGSEVRDILFATRGFTYLLPDSDPDPLIILERELLLRKYRAVTEGKISTTGTPDYVGTWDVDCPMRGLFEVFINREVEGKSFDGMIEDSLGTAYLEGEIDSKYASFLKTYIDGKSSVSAVKQPILYEGELRNGSYVGEYSFRTIFDTVFRANFTLNAGSKLEGN